MILTPHILTGVAIGSQVSHPVGIALLAIASHFLLDMLPHIEYEIGEIKNGKLDKKFIRDFSKVALDLVIGFAIALIVMRQDSNIYAILWGGVCAGIPDFLLFVYYLTKAKFLEKLNEIHEGPVHIFKHRKVQYAIRILFQVAVAAIAILIIRK